MGGYHFCVFLRFLFVLFCFVFLFDILVKNGCVCEV